MNKKKELISFSKLVKNRWKYIEYVDRKRWKTKKTIIYFLDYDNKNEYIEIEEGFEFDFNSSPKIFHFIVDRDEFVSALFHDYLYSRIWKVKIKNINNLSSTFKKFEKYIIWYEMNFSDDNDEIEAYYNRKFADLIWYYMSFEEQKICKRNLNKFKIFLAYLWIRVWWFLKFKR